MNKWQIEFVEALDHIFSLPHKGRDAAMHRVVNEYRKWLDQCFDEMPPASLDRFDGTNVGMSYDDFAWSVTNDHIHPRALKL